MKLIDGQTNKFEIDHIEITKAGETHTTHAMHTQGTRTTHGGQDTTQGVHAVCVCVCVCLYIYIRMYVCI